MFWKYLTPVKSCSATRECFCTSRIGFLKPILKGNETSEMESNLFRSQTLFRRCRSCSLPSWFIRKCLWCGIIRRTGKSDRKHSWVCISIENHSIQYRFLAKFTAFWHIQGPPNQDPDHWAGSYDQNTSLGTAEGRSMAGIVGSDTHRDHRIRFVKKKTLISSQTPTRICWDFKTFAADFLNNSRN